MAVFIPKLQEILRRIDGRGYKAYQDIKGVYETGEFLLSIDHVQGDPFASPSRLSVKVPLEESGFPPELYSSKVRRIALQDYLARAFDMGIAAIASGRRGTGRSGLIAIDAGGQEVLERNAVLIEGKWLEARFVVGLPAAGRTVLGHQAEEMLCGELPEIVRRALYYRSHDGKKVQMHVESIEDQEFLRAKLKGKGLVAFIGNGSILPRRSGVDERPLRPGADQVVVPFHSPPDLEVEFHLPNKGLVRGMGIPQGITLIVGGGFHGKSTLLRAIERGVYNHIPGDGRELVVTLPEAVKIRAEDGRFVEKVNISPFIGDLPYSKGTKAFSTENASGSTSQAANIMEALEVGARLLLIDEDTSATNFMIRDERMQELVSKDKEPITPFMDKARQLFHDHGVSTILVMGGSGDYFEIADTVILMEEYHPRHVTRQVREILKALPGRRRPEGGEVFGEIPSRRPLPESFDPSRGSRDVKIDAKGLKAILFGTTAIDLSAVEQLVDLSQTRAIGEAIFYYASNYARRGLSLKEGLDLLMADLDRGGLDILVPYKAGNLARPRVFELAAAINRMRSLKVQ
ncbi:MAG: ABC-ATPase domain-containing protein [candidate division NC10 bacterium]|nr:ABC-ATPase domain-containing protein [candidate division NC10 bacterium]